jgi:hypothetical protein
LLTGLVIYYNEEDMHAFIAIEIYVHVPYVMERSAASFSPSQCLIYITDSQILFIFAWCIAGAGLGDSCIYERASVYGNSCCV